MKFLVYSYNTKNGANILLGEITANDLAEAYAQANLKWSNFYIVKA